MINTVYRLVEPRQFDVSYEELPLAASRVIIRPEKLSICKADQRYYQGTRSRSALQKKLPMALIHECAATVVYDPTGQFRAGEWVVPIPNIPMEQDDVIAENYRFSSVFRGSGYDGFMQDYVSYLPERLVRIPEGVNLTVAAFTEIISVCMHAISRFERVAHSRRNTIGIWGDGNVGFIVALLLRQVYPHTKLYIMGTVPEKLSYFTFADGTFHVDELPDDFYVDHAFECVGGAGSVHAIEQIIGHINPEGAVSLLGVSESPVGINTRMVLEKGLFLFGSSRSGKADFERTVSLLQTCPALSHYLENIVGEEVSVRSIADMHNAFALDFSRNFGKTVMDWNK